MRKLLLGIVAVLIVAGGGLYWGLAIYPTRLFRASVDATIAALPAGYSASYTGASYSLFSSTAILTGVSVHRPEPNAFDVAIEQVTLVHPATDIGASWAKAAADPAKIAPGFALPVADEVSLKGFTYRGANDRVALASMRVSHPRLYPWALLHPGVPSLAEARASLMARTHAPQPGDFLPLLRAEALWTLGFGYDAYEAEGLDAHGGVPATENAPPTEVSYTIQKMTSGRYDRGTFASTAFDGLTMRSELFGSLGVAHAEIEGLDVQQPLAALLDGQDMTPALLDGISLKSMSYGPMSVQGAVGAPSVLGTFSLANLAFRHGWLVSIDLAFDGVRVNRDQIPNLNAVDALDRLGLDAMTFDFDLAYRWDLAKGEMTVAKAVLAVKELGSLTLSFDVANAATPQDFGTKARLVHAVLLYQDASLAERAIKMAAEEKGSNPDDLRAQIIGTLQQIQKAPDATAASAATARAMGDFLNAPHSLALELAPKEPVPLLTLLSAGQIPPQRLVPMLGLSIAANR